MLKWIARWQASLLAILLVCLVFSPNVSGQTNNESRDAERAKFYVASLGVEQRVIVKMRAGGELKGYISEVGEDSFTLRTRKAKATTQVAYTEVFEVIRDEKESSYPVKKVLLIGGTIFAVFAIIGAALGG